MPTFDTGHLFLTFLCPIRAGSTTDKEGTTASYEQRLRTTLALLPTALQSPATQGIGINSPFARNRRTHLCRFMVLEDVIYNGRNPSDAIVAAVNKSDPVVPQPVDRLNCGYLLFSADIDAVQEEGDALPATLDAAGQNRARDAYAHRLWETMEPELKEIFSNCVDFDGVDSAASFAAYLGRCQVETTMPFNDYWISPPALKTLPVVPMAAAALTPLVVTLLALIGWLGDMDHIPLLSGLVSWSPGTALLWGTIITAGVFVALLRYIIVHGEQPMPPAKYGDLPSVLKSLYLQQHFADFVVEQQGRSDAELHAAFTEFLAAHRPEDKMAPSQAPGVIDIHASQAIIH